MEWVKGDSIKSNKEDNCPSRRNSPANPQRLVSLDTVRGLCILSVVSTHFVTLAAPRVAYHRCDALRPLSVDCGWANAFSFLVFNVIAVCVLAVLSGISANLRSPASLGRRGTRFFLLSAAGVLCTSGVFAFGLIDPHRLVDSFAVLPFTNPSQLFFPGNDPSGGLGDLLSGQALHQILTGTASGRSFAWPFLWCVPWFLLGWTIIWLSKSVPAQGGKVLRVAGMALSLALPDQGIIACMLIGYAFGRKLAEFKPLVSCCLLGMGSAVAMLPAVRLVPNAWPDLVLSEPMVSALQVCAALSVTTGLLGLLQKAGPSPYSAIGRQTLLVYALHWPFLLLTIDLLLKAGLHPEWISHISIAFLLLSATAIPLAIGLSIKRRQRQI